MIDRKLSKQEIEILLELDKFLNLFKMFRRSSTLDQNIIEHNIKMMEEVLKARAISNTIGE